MYEQYHNLRINQAVQLPTMAIITKFQNLVVKRAFDHYVLSEF
jgi:hypothetical protein